MLVLTSVEAAAAASAASAAVGVGVGVGGGIVASGSLGSVFALANTIA